ncbi:MAG TPA: hypothetical protein VN624_01375 [Rhodanobacter sp.]|nr:hypothetical protein [Rhodanobacter sp.]
MKQRQGKGGHASHRAPRIIGRIGMLTATLFAAACLVPGSGTPGKSR